MIYHFSYLPKLFFFFYFILFIQTLIHYLPLELKQELSAEDWDRSALERIVRILDQKNVDVCDYATRKYGRDGETLLHSWIRLNINDEGIHKRLLEYGTDVNATTASGKSILHVAVFRGEYEITKSLLNKGAYVNSHNKDKNTPLHFAVDSENIKLCTLLLIQGADPNYINAMGETPLSRAAKFSYPEVVRLLLTYGGNAARIDFSGEKRQAEMDSSQPIQDLCRQNISNSEGNAFIRHNGKISVLLY